MKDNNFYTVALQFDAQDPRVRQLVVDKLAKLDPAVAMRLADIAQDRIIVKRNACLATAQRLVRFFKPTGAVCRVRRQPAAEETTAESDAAEQARARSPRPAMRCPNCDHEQPRAMECRACGAVIAKARRHRRRPSPKPTLTPKAPEKPARSAPLEQMRRRILAAVEAWLKNPPIRPVTIQDRWKRLADRLLSCGVVLVVALLLETALLYLFKVLWFIYTATDVGIYYLQHFPEKAGAITQLMAADLLLLSWDCSLTVLYVSLLVSVSAQWLHLISYLFNNQGPAVKLVFWCAPVATLAAWGMVQRYDALIWPLAIGVTLVPTLCILSSCMQLARDAIPEMGTVWHMLTRTAGDGEPGPLTRIKCKLCAWINAHL